MKQYKNFSVLLKAAIDKKMQEAGVFHFWLECSKDHEEYTKSKESFFESLDDITLNYLQGVKTQFPPDDESPSGSEAWVSVEDRLPDDGTKEEHRAFLCMPHYRILPFYENKFWEFDTKWDEMRVVNRITHWQPLPQPPIK